MILYLSGILISLIVWIIAAKISKIVLKEDEGMLTVQDIAICSLVSIVLSWFALIVLVIGVPLLIIVCYVIDKGNKRLF